MVMHRVQVDLANFKIKEAYMKKTLKNIIPGGAHLGMDTKMYREGLHLYMVAKDIYVYSDGTKEEKIRIISEHIDRKRAMEIMKDIEERLF
jgi:hypothetical protein